MSHVLDVTSDEALITKHSAPDYEQIKRLFDQQKAWGLLTSIDLSGCDPDLIRSATAIEVYVVELCDLIKMKRFGEPTIINFGEDERVAGYSLAQFIETSMISGHFANVSNKAYIDIFSCKLYNPDVASEFTRSYFKAKSSKLNVLIRS